MSIKTWKERWRNPWLYKRDAMQAEIDELRAEIKRLTGIAFLASAERDELRMELGDLPEAQADMLATIKAQRKVLEQAMEALQYCVQEAGPCEHECGVCVCKEASAITAIQEVLNEHN